MKLAALDPKFNLTDQVSPIQTALPSQGYLDVSLLMTIRKAFDLRFGINNLLDRQPPLVVGNTAAGGASFFGNTYPQWYDPLGRYLFATLSIALNP